MGDHDFVPDLRLVVEFVEATCGRLQADEVAVHVVVTGTACLMRDFDTLDLGRVSLHRTEHVPVDERDLPSRKVSSPIGDAPEADGKSGWTISIFAHALVAIPVKTDIAQLKVPFRGDLARQPRRHARWSTGYLA